MASEQETVPVPQENVEGATPTEEATTEPTTDAAPAAEYPEETTDAAPPVESDETTTTEEGAPAKVSTKEKITGKLQQTTDKIKGAVTGIKEKVSPSKN